MRWLVFLLGSVFICGQPSFGGGVADIHLPFEIDDVSELEAGQLKNRFSEILNNHHLARDLAFVAIDSFIALERRDQKRPLKPLAQTIRNWLDEQLHMVIRSASPEQLEWLSILIVDKSSAFRLAAQPISRRYLLLLAEIYFRGNRSSLALLKENMSTDFVTALLLHLRYQGGQDQGVGIRNVIQEFPGVLDSMASQALLVRYVALTDMRRERPDDMTSVDLAELAILTRVRASASTSRPEWNATQEPKSLNEKYVQFLIDHFSDNLERQIDELAIKFTRPGESLSSADMIYLKTLAIEALWTGRAETLRALLKLKSALQDGGWFKREFSRAEMVLRRRGGGVPQGYPPFDAAERPYLQLVPRCAGLFIKYL